MQLLRINFRTVLKLHRENAVVLRLLFHAADLNEDFAVIAVSHFSFCKCAYKNRSIFIIGINFCSLKITKIAIPFCILLHILCAGCEIFKRNGIKAVLVLCFKLAFNIRFRAFIGNISIEAIFAVSLYKSRVKLVGVRIATSIL